MKTPTLLVLPPMPVRSTQVLERERIEARLGRRGECIDHRRDRRH